MSLSRHRYELPLFSNERIFLRDVAKITMKDKKQQKQTNKLPILIKMERNYAAAIVLNLVEINPPSPEGP